MTVAGHFLTFYERVNPNLFYVFPAFSTFVLVFTSTFVLVFTFFSTSTCFIPYLYLLYLLTVLSYFRYGLKSMASRKRTIHAARAYMAFRYFLVSFRISVWLSSLSTARTAIASTVRFECE
jgi:hypothetical protein